MYIGNLDERVTDALVWELMLQAGRIVSLLLHIVLAVVGVLGWRANHRRVGQRTPPQGPSHANTSGLRFRRIHLRRRC